MRWKILLAVVSGVLTGAICVFALLAATPKRLSQYHPDLLRTLRPYGQSHRSGVRGDLTRLYDLDPINTFSQNVRLDRFGFRNRGDREHYDVVISGDSFVWCGFLKDRELLSGQLARISGRAVGNFALPGYGPQQQLYLVEHLLISLDPDTFIWCFFEGNDLSDAASYERNRANGRNYFEARTSGERLNPAQRSPCRAFGECGSERYWFHYRPFGPRRGYNTSIDCIAEAAAICRREGIRFLFVFIPTKFRAYNAAVDIPPDSICSRWECDDLPQRLTGDLLDLGIESVDLSKPFQRAAERGESMYYVDDTHWTARANEIAASMIASRLKFGGQSVQAGAAKADD